MDITCDPRLLICILLLFPLAFISKITSEPFQSDHSSSERSLKLSPNNYSWKKRLVKVFSHNWRKKGKSSVDEVLPSLESSIAPSSESELKFFPPKLWLSLLNNLVLEITNTGRPGCTCSDPNPEGATIGRACSTTCLTSETWCYGQTCTRTTTFSALYFLFT